MLSNPGTSKVMFAIFFTVNKEYMVVDIFHSILSNARSSAKRDYLKVVKEIFIAKLYYTLLCVRGLYCELE